MAQSHAHHSRDLQQTATPNDRGGINYTKQHEGPHPGSEIVHYNRLPCSP
jgi:hypothetical protein